MAERVRHRTGGAPAPVVGAMLLVVMSAFARIPGVIDIFDGAWAAAVSLLLLATYGAIAYGLWRGWRASQVLAILGGVFAVLGGLASDDPGAFLGVVAGGAVAALLLVPESARRWYR